MDRIEFLRIGDHDLPLPSRESSLAAGIDLRIVGPLALLPGNRKLVKTGFAVALPPYVAGMICPRSGLALKDGLTVLNAPGIVDADYRGEIGVILHNSGHELIMMDHGSRIAQLVPVLIEPRERSMIVEVDSLGDTPRGDCGFGSTGNG